MLGAFWTFSSLEYPRLEPHVLPSERERCLQWWICQLNALVTFVHTHCTELDIYSPWTKRDQEMQFQPVLGRCGNANLWHTALSSVWMQVETRCRKEISDDPNQLWKLGYSTDDCSHGKHTELSSKEVCYTTINPVKMNRKLLPS